MKVLILGIDGYLGFPLAQYLANRGHEVFGCDALLRRYWVDKVGSQSAIPIKNNIDRKLAFNDRFNQKLFFKILNIEFYSPVRNLIKFIVPDAIFHLAENPSAPYSMIGAEEAWEVHRNNLKGTLNVLYAMHEFCPEAHLIKLGTMGEYGTPSIDIPEGFFTINYRGREDRLPFPRQAGSWYHQTKVHDSNNIMMACRLWGLRSTDIMQGVVYGTQIDEMQENPNLRTRFDFDQCFGTAINRFCAQAVIGEPLTPYGKGHQRRGFLPLRDSMQCLTIALENPPQFGEYRVFNQFEEVYDLTELAYKVQAAGNRKGLKVEIRNIDNPRKELEEHYYNPDHKQLLDLGYNPTRDMDSELDIMFEDLIQYRYRIIEKKHVLMPDIRWDGTRKISNYL